MRGAARAHRTRVAADAPDAAPRIGIVRNLPNTYEMDAYGNVVPSNPSANWTRAGIVRAANPILSGHLRLPPPVPMYDPTMGPPEYWRR